MCSEKGGLAGTRKSAERLVNEPLNVSLALLSGFRSKVCIVSEGLIWLSLCTHIPRPSSRSSQRMETKQ